MRTIFAGLLLGAVALFQASTVSAKETKPSESKSNRQVVKLKVGEEFMLDSTQVKVTAVMKMSYESYKLYVKFFSHQEFPPMENLVFTTIGGTRIKLEDAGKMSITMDGKMELPGFIPD